MNKLAYIVSTLFLFAISVITPTLVNSANDTDQTSDMVSGKKTETMTIKLSELDTSLLKQLSETIDESTVQYELAKRYLHGDRIEKNQYLAEQYLFLSILNDAQNKNAMELLEKELGWHCMLSDDGRCLELINQTSTV